MNISSQVEREIYFSSFKKEWKALKSSGVKIVICPPTIHLEAFVKKMPKQVSFGAQNIFWEDSGSFTGETSPLALKHFGCEYVLVGHSERRRYFGETDEEVNLKIRSALKNGLLPIVCVGESREERRTGNTKQVITRQVKGAFREISAARLEQIILAYEPIWSVGTDNIPTANEIMEVKVLIQKIITEQYSQKCVEKISIIYGGSVSTKTVKQTCLDSGMDGALVGRESLAPFEFLKIACLLDNKEAV